MVVGLVNFAKVKQIANLRHQDLVVFTRRVVNLLHERQKGAKSKRGAEKAAIDDVGKISGDLGIPDMLGTLQVLRSFLIFHVEVVAV